MIYFILIFYVFYNYMMFKYTGQIFGQNIKLRSKLLFAILANSFLVFLPVYVTSFKFEYAIMILYLVIIGLEMRLFFKQNLIKLLLAVLSFAINFFAVRIIIIGVLSLINDVQISVYVQDINARLLITALSFFAPIPYILITKKLLPGKAFELLLSSKKNLTFLVIMLSVTYLNQIVNAAILLTAQVQIGDVNLIAYSQIRSGLFTICIFVIMMLSMQLFSALRHKEIKFDTISKEIVKQENIVQELRVVSNIDDFTGFYVRNVAYEEIEAYVKNKDEFFILFVDIDGLKTVNDTYGHEEGDCYILAISDIIKQHFADQTKARLGGDEFLILGKITNTFEVEQKVKLVNTEIEAFSKNNDKKYKSSISYGLMFVFSDNELSADELIRKADEKMYNSKKMRKKARGTVNISE